MFGHSNLSVQVLDENLLYQNHLVQNLCSHREHPTRAPFRDKMEHYHFYEFSFSFCSNHQNLFSLTVLSQIIFNISIIDYFSSTRREFSSTAGCHSST